MHTLLTNLDDFLEGKEPLADDKEDARFVDRWFNNEMVRLIGETYKYYEAMYFREALRTGYFMFKGKYKEYLDICRAGLGLPNKTLIMRYFEWQTIILSPIAPHFCEHVWSKLGKPGTVLKSRWPEPATKVDASVIAGGDYMFNTVPHDFTTRRDKLGKPESAVVYVASEFAPWKVSVLKMMRDKLAAGKITMLTQDGMKANPEAAEQWKEFIKEVMQDPEAKKQAKHVGPFAAFKRDQAVEFGASALDATVPFDEMKLMLEHIAFLKAKLGLEITVCDANNIKDKSHEQSASAAQPGQPGVHFVGGAAPSAKAKPDKSGGGDKKAAPKAVANVNGKGHPGTISDLKALNVHLSTRSYMEGGPKPSAADAAQLAAIPSAVVSQEELPHVARWLKHIKSFAAAQRSSWK
jgi:leucyl-tRNA synthetase